jgi:hypothetical protein
MPLILQGSSSGSVTLNVPSVAGISTLLLPNTGGVLIANTSTTSNVQINSLGVGTDASGVTGEIRAANNITAYYSDERLKENLGNITNPIDKIMSLNGFYYKANYVAKSHGFNTDKKEVGLSAQQVEKILPEIIDLAPFDSEYIEGRLTSKSGENYLTLHYERLIPLLVEAIKEQQKQIDELKDKIKNS